MEHDTSLQPSDTQAQPTDAQDGASEKEAQEEATRGPQVVIYSTPSCHFCHMAKEFLTEKGVPFTDYNVAEDAEKRQEMVEKSGQMGVPVIFVGEEMIIGFDEPRLTELLGL